jgi:hypothetical protein
MQLPAKAFMHLYSLPKVLSDTEALQAHAHL